MNWEKFEAVYAMIGPAGVALVFVALFAVYLIVWQLCYMTAVWRNFRRDFLAADNHRFRIRVRLRQIRKRRFHVLNDCEAFRGKNFAYDLVQFCRNQNFFHCGVPFILLKSSIKIPRKVESYK